MPDLATFIILFEFFSLQPSPFIFLSELLVFTSIPLFYFNLRHKKKIFLGDSGSLLLGGVVSFYVIYVLSNNYIIKPEYDIHKVFYVLSILTYPIIDIIRIFFKRIIEGKSPFDADKNHIHHLILKKTNSHIVTTLILALTSIIFLIFIQIIF